MEKFTTLISTAVPLALANVDTDMIYPSMNTTSTKAGILKRNSDFFARHGFSNLRYDSSGNPNPDCVFNMDQYQGSRILIALENFACGSSREMAVWSLMDMGFRAVIAPSFGDIFFSNACINGLLPVCIDRATVLRMLTSAKRPDSRFVVDLESLTVTTPEGEQIGFKLDGHRRHLLLNGLDEVGLSLKSLPLIDAHEERYLANHPWLRPLTNAFN